MRVTSTVAAILLFQSVLAPAGALARDVPVASAAELRAAIDAALAGDVILLAGGTYDVTANLVCRASGTASEPIVVRALRPLGARIRFDTLEGFVVRGPHWRFEDLDIEGVCADDSSCEHAWHIVGAADATVVRRNRVQGFNAHIKANGEGDPRVFPDDVLIEENELFNPRVRMTSNPVTPIDVVGGRRWIVRANFIHDHHKGMGNGISYAAFLKGNSSDGLIERNLVICELLHTGGTRLGLSFGGGGSSPDGICEEGSCTPEHQNGLMRNNVIVGCPADVGVYVNACAGCRILHNTVHGSTGIDVRFAASDVTLAGNLLSGRIRARDGATLTSVDNLEMVTDAQFGAFFRDPAGAEFTLLDGSAIVDVGSPLADLPDDFCGNDRDDGRPDLGAVEHDGDGPCDTTRPGIGPSPADGGASTLDAGPSDRDAGTMRSDAGPRTDGSIDAGTEPASGGGCGCRALGSSPPRSMWLALLAIAARLRRRSSLAVRVRGTT